MTPSLAYSYSWSLHDSDFAQVCDIMEHLRQHAIELGSQSVSDLIVEPNARQVYFTATLPGATEGKYGLSSTGIFSWNWSGAVVASSVKRICEFHQMAASLGIKVIESYAGMVFTSKLNAEGTIETEQRSAIDWTDF